MITTTYKSAVESAAERAPALPTSLTPGKTNNFFSWVEDVSAILADIYSMDYLEVMEDLVKKIKEVQDVDH